MNYMKQSTTSRKIIMSQKKCIAAALSLLFVSSSVTAAYTVIDEDLLPTPMNEPQQQRAQQKVLQQNYQSFPDDSFSTQSAAEGLYKEYLIPFFKKSSALTQEGIQALKNLLPMIGEGSIKIIGRQDASIGTKNGLDKLAVNRANKMRDYLTKQGIPASSIFIEVDNNPNPQMNGNIYPSTIVLNSPSHQTYVEPSSMMTAVKEPAQAQVQRMVAKKDPVLQAVKQMPAPSAGAALTKTKLVGIIYQSAESGQLDQMLAVKLLRVLLENSSDPAYAQQPVNTPIQQPAVYKPAPTQYRTQAPAQAVAPIISVQQTQPAPLPQVSQNKWQLKPEKTLKDNIEAWAKISNYTVKWNASNFYKVGKSSVITGEFLDVVDKVSVAAGVDMAVSNKTSTIFINDRP